MRLAYIACLASAVILSGCAIPEHPATAALEQPPYRRFEKICYDWESRGVEVAFDRLARDSAWIMTLRDSWDVYERSLSGEGKVWDQSSSRCSTKQCVEMLDQALTQFQAEKPNAELGSVHIEMQVVQEIWAEVLGGLRPTLATIHEAKTADRADDPRKVHDKILDVLDRSATVAAIKNVLARHGIKVRDVHITGQTIFRDSLTGKEWSDIGDLPGLGILLPGRFELAIKAR
jgi:hypothetical protein